MKFFLVIFSLTLLLIPFQNCSMVTAPQEIDENSNSQSSSSATLPGDPLYAKQSQNILLKKCSSCHGSMGQGGVSNITDLAGLVQQNLVLPQDPDNSSIVISVESGSMPPSGTALNSGEIGTLRAWIMSLQAAPVIPPPPPSATTTTTTTLPPPPPSTNLLCQIVATPSSSVVPGDSVSVKLTWSKFNIAPTNAVLDGMSYDVRGLTNVTANIVQQADKLYTASVTGSEGTANCQLNVTVKATTSLTKDEFYRAKIGPNSQSVNDLIEKRCFSCHGAAGQYANSAYSTSTYFQLASPHLLVVKGNWMTNLAALRNAKDKALGKLDLTLSTSAPNAGSMASGHKALAPLTSAESNHVKAFVAKP